MNSSAEPISAGPLRRLGAMLYDTLLVIAVLMVATLPFVLVANDAMVPSKVGAMAYLYWTWEIGITAAYFGIFWTRKNRTLGMQAWRLGIQRIDGAPVAWRDALARFGSACLPWLPGFALMTIAEHSDSRSTLLPIGAALLAAGFMNYFAAYWTAGRRALHEQWLATRIVRTE
jgi:uncharacterized RDD family membrane protein YckC